MTIFGAQGIRDAMTKSYHRHIRKLQGYPKSDGTTLHQASLYGALASRYMVGFKNVSEAAIWAELTPFLTLDPDDGLIALAEYVVYKEMPTKADVELLTRHINNGLSLHNEEDREVMEQMAIINNCVWIMFKE